MAIFKTRNGTLEWNTGIERWNRTLELKAGMEHWKEHWNRTRKHVAHSIG
jgi:hypothetical protein